MVMIDGIDCLMLCFCQLQVVVKHVSNEELSQIESVAADLFIIGGQDALEKRQKEQQAAAAAAADSAYGSDKTAADASETNGVVAIDDDCVVMDEVAVTEHRNGAATVSDGKVKRGLAEIEILEEDNSAKKARTD